MTNKKPNENDRRIKKQVVLPFFKSIDIAYKSIRARLLRSLITTVTLVLAIAFLCFTQISNDIANGLFNSDAPGIHRALRNAGHDIANRGIEAEQFESREHPTIKSTPKQRWIVILSLLVCVVGIINAQLMAVTERFREIGTMKCLGALDHFIVRIFLLEALIQGVIGSFSGAFLGALAALGDALFHYGTALLPHVVPRTIILTMISTVAIGSILSLIGVIYPVIVAARMQPVDAMRLDN